MNEHEELLRLRKQLGEQEESAKMLVRRDLELTRAYKKLEELGNTKDDFVSVVAHQLRTPLSITKWALDMLSEINQESLTAEQVQVLIRAQDSNSRMIALVDDLLKVDLHDGGKAEYSFDSVDLGEIVTHVTAELDAIATRRFITLSTQINTTIPHVRGDGEKLSSVVQNLVENALKYTPKGGVVIVTVSVDTESVVVAVKDTGIGIPQTEKHKLFTRFYRAENAIKTVTDGSGLGLYIAKKIVKRHGGDIWFESEEGKGAIFFFSIPIAIKKRH